jgi:phage-related protein
MELDSPKDWQSAQRYEKNDLVTHNGAVYYCIIGNRGISPLNSTYWSNGTRFSWVPTYGSYIAEEPFVEINEFGDGYAQRSPYGITNNPMRAINLKFEGISDKETTAILHFIFAHAGFRPFEYKVMRPYEKELEVICRQHKHVVNFDNNNTVTLLFEEFYEPSEPIKIQYTYSGVAIDQYYKSNKRLYAENAFNRRIESFELSEWEYYNEAQIKNVPYNAYFFAFTEMYAPLNNFGKWDGDWVKLRVTDNASLWDLDVQSEVEYYDGTGNGTSYRPYILDGRRIFVLVKTASIRDESALANVPVISSRESYTPQLFPFQTEETIYDYYPPNEWPWFAGYNHVSRGYGAFVPIDIGLKLWWNLNGAEFTHEGDRGSDIDGIFIQKDITGYFSSKNKIYPVTGLFFDKRYYDDYGIPPDPEIDYDEEPKNFGADPQDYTIQSSIWAWFGRYGRTNHPNYDSDSEDQKSYGISAYGVAETYRYRWFKLTGQHYNTGAIGGLSPWVTFTPKILPDKNIMISPCIQYYGIDDTMAFSFPLGGGSDPDVNNSSFLSFTDGLVGCGPFSTDFNPPMSMAPISYGNKIYISAGRCGTWSTTALLPTYMAMYPKYYTFY